MRTRIEGMALFSHSAVYAVRFVHKTCIHRRFLRRFIGAL
jgi:hypothetical protein